MIPLVSIIVPVHNAGEYFAECLGSLAGQTLPADAYEIIVVDDKSADSSLETARDFERRYPNVHVIALPERTPGGPGFPSNIGIKTARGKYVAFLDHDDAAHPEMLEKLAHAAEAANADVTFCSFHVLHKGSSGYAPPYDIEVWEELFSEDITAMPLVEQKQRYLKVAPAPWRKLYNREYLLRNTILFPVSDFAFEDMVFHWRAIIPAKRFTHIDDRLIFYKTGYPGQTTSMGIQKAAPHFIRQLREIKDFLEKRDIFPTYKETLKYTAASLHSLVPDSSPLYAEFTNEIAAIF